MRASAMCLQNQWILWPLCTYIRLSLSRLRLSRIPAYFEMKIWSLFKYESLTTKYCGKGAISPLFHNIFNISLTSGVKLHIQLWNVIVRFIFSSILQIWYVEVQISRSIAESPLDFEITRVDYVNEDKSYCLGHVRNLQSDYYALYMYA